MDQAPDEWLRVIDVSLNPGYVRAGMGVAVQSTKAGPMSGEDIFARYDTRRVPLRRMIEAEELGNVDGGFVMS